MLFLRIMDSLLFHANFPLYRKVRTTILMRRDRKRERKKNPYFGYTPNNYPIL